jgi:DNA-binding protein HU-beta
MNKGELVTAIADRTDVSKADVERVLRGFEEVVQRVVADGDNKLTLPGFLSIEQVDRAARTSFNPRTREPLEIAAHKSVKITAGSTLKDVANGGRPAPS